MLPSGEQFATQDSRNASNPSRAIVWTSLASTSPARSMGLGRTWSQRCSVLAHATAQRRRVFPRALGRKKINKNHMKFPRFRSSSMYTIYIFEWPWQEREVICTIFVRKKNVLVDGFFFGITQFFFGWMPHIHSFTGGHRWKIILKPQGKWGCSSYGISTG